MRKREFREGENMQKIIIDEEFKALLPALDKDTYALLEENLLQNGCRDSIVLWGNVLIDGHNRYEICSKHKIPFNTVSRDFASREEALIWIISTQVSRRNLSPIQLSHFRGLHYKMDKLIQGANNRYTTKSRRGQNVPQGRTADRLAEKYRVSSKTINRDAKVASAIEAIGEVSPTAKKMILSGEAILDKSKLQQMAGLTEEETEAVAAAIENGTYEKQPASTTGPETSNPTRPIDSILAKLPPLQQAIRNLSNSFSVLPKVRKSADRAELKAELRSCINQFEDLYDQVR